jgi:hypothetical protein
VKSEAWEDFKDTVLAAPVDVEELAAMGRRKKVTIPWDLQQHISSSRAPRAAGRLILWSEAAA